MDPDGNIDVNTNVNLDGNADVNTDVNPDGNADVNTDVNPDRNKNVNTFVCRCLPGSGRLLSVSAASACDCIFRKEGRICPLWSAT